MSSPPPSPAPSISELLSSYEFFPPAKATVQLLCSPLSRSSFCSASSGLTLVYYTLTPAMERKSWRGCVVFMHGLLEHSLRYLHVFQLLASHGWAVASLDGRGHGLSAGEQGLINDMYEMVADQKQFIALITEMDLAGPGRYHVWGQSYGGLLAALTVLESPKGSIASCLLTSPAMANELDCTLKIIKAIKLGELIAFFNPTLKMVDIVPPSGMSKSKREQDRYANDPLNSPGPIMIKTGVEISHAQDDAFRRVAEFTTPLWVGFGTKDIVNYAPGALEFLNQASTPADRKEFKWYDGLFHTLAFEDERDQVFEDMIAFLERNS